ENCGNWKWHPGDPIRLHKMMITGGKRADLPLDRSEWRQTDVRLFSDPKVKEMEHFAEVSQGNLSISTTGGDSPRKDGIRDVDRELKRILETGSPRRRGNLLTGQTIAGILPSPRLQSATGTLLLQRGLTSTSVTNSNESPTAGQKAASPRFTAEGTEQGLISWHREKDKQIRRLMDDVELGRRMPLAGLAHQMVCEQFEKRYNWFQKSLEPKQVARPQMPGIAPAFLKFDPAKPPMPGSTRAVAPK
ncbi:unnamed protein product, partial [Polarella glacialis]